MCMFLCVTISIAKPPTKFNVAFEMEEKYPIKKKVLTEWSEPLPLYGKRCLIKTVRGQLLP